MFTYDENLQLELVSMKKLYCSHCGKEISLNIANIHLLVCRPEVHDAIQLEYDRKEAIAIAIAN